MSLSSDTTSGTSSSTSISTSSPTNSPSPSTSSSTGSPTLTPTETPTISAPSTSSTVSPSTSTSALTSQSNLSTSSPPPVTSPSTSVSISTSNGGLVTVTSVVAVTPTRNVPSATSAAAAPASKGFFQNKGAVAGVFTVVGLVALAILIALVTNTIRRRRAKKFDREIAEAAAEAAAVPAPAFDDDDDHYGPTSGGGGYGGYGGQYSDVSSHGTYAQPPVSISSHGETYNMRELGPGPSPGEIYNSHDPYAAFAAGGAAGAAGIGVARARSTREPGGYAAALQDGGNPYAAFVAPPPLQQQPQSDTYDNDPTGLQRGISLQHQQQQNYSDLSRSTSQGARSGDSYYPASSASPQSAESYPPQYQSAAPSIAGLAPYAYPPNQGNVSRSTSGGPAHHSTSQHDDAAYGAIGAAALQPSPIRTVHEDYGEESSGDEDEGPGKRVLKVANE